MKMDPYLTYTQTLTWNGSKTQTLRPKTIKLWKENRGKFHDIEFGNDFSDMTESTSDRRKSLNQTVSTLKLLCIKGHNQWRKKQITNYTVDDIQRVITIIYWVCINWQRLNWNRKLGRLWPNNQKKQIQLANKHKRQL